MSIHIRSLVHVYGTGAGAVTALQGLDLTVQDGEICIVRGPNGSGKTTLISILTGSFAPTAGEVRVSEINGAPPRVAVIRQFDDLAPELTVREHFELLAASHDLALLPDALQAKRVAALTHAERQHVAIALALALQPDLLLADEPTGALARDDAAAVYALLEREVRARHVTLLLVTHDERAESIADRVVRLQEGRVSQEWVPGAAPRQVVDDRGWLRLPDTVRDRMERLVAVQPSETGATIIGRGTDAGPAASTPQRSPFAEDPVLRLDHVTLAFAGPRSITATVHRGSITAVTGAPGAGKTSLLRTLAGIAPVGSGTLHWFDGDGQLPAAYFSADLPFATHLSLRELEVREEILTALDLVGLSSRPLRTLSGGQRQRAVVALALAHPCRIVLLDDPTTSLDGDSVHRVVSTVAASGKTFIIATHDARVIAAADATIELER